jgi:fructose-1,6-bisphosphatase I
MSLPIPSTTLTGVVTIERHILMEQSRFPDSTGSLTNIPYDLALAAKLIASRTQRGGLADILGDDRKH